MLKYVGSALLTFVVMQIGNYLVFRVLRGPSHNRFVGRCAVSFLTILVPMSVSYVLCAALTLPFSSLLALIPFALILQNDARQLLTILHVPQGAVSTAIGSQHKTAIKATVIGDILGYLCAIPVIEVLRGWSQW